MKPVQNLSRAVSLVAQFWTRESAYYDDIAAWGAPSECYRDLYRGAPRRFRNVRKHVEGITGLKWRLFVRECEARVPHKWWHHRGPQLSPPRS